MSRSFKRSLIRVVIFSLATFGASHLLAAEALQRGDQVTPGERALLPDYCNYTQSFSNENPTSPSPAARKYEAILGKAMWGMHHYCIGLVHMMRAERFSTPPLRKKYHWEQVVNETTYVIRDALSNNQPDFVMLPEIYLNRGKALFRLKNFSEAGESMRSSIKAKPDYWPTYAAWADELIALGRHADAKAILEEGLKQTPDAKALLARLAQLDKTPKQRPSPNEN